MGCKCSCGKKLEHVDQVIHDYDPKDSFLNYKVTTIWINRKTKKAWLLVSKEGGIAVWDPINIDINAIEKIILDCGEVAPNENGEIIVKGNCGLRTVQENCPDFCFILRTGFGLKGGGQICNGEEREIELDTEITGDVQGLDSANVGDLAVFKDETGKSITPSNINSVDGLTQITKSSAGEQLFKVETIDTEAGSNAGVEAKSTSSGYPYFQLTQGDNKWRGRVNPDTGALEIRPVDDLSKGSILSMLPNGVILSPYKIIARARLGNTPEINPINNFPIGSNLSFIISEDKEGYDDVNNFFPGASGQGAYYITTYDGIYYKLEYQFLINKTPPIGDETFTFKISYNGENYTHRGFIPSNFNFSTIKGSIEVKSKKDEKITFYISFSSGGVNFGSFSATEIDNYINIYSLG